MLCEAAALSATDVAQCQGQLGEPSRPCVPGVFFTGKVERLGQLVRGLRLGELVLGLRSQAAGVRPRNRHVPLRFLSVLEGFGLKKGDSSDVWSARRASRRLAATARACVGGLGRCGSVDEVFTSPACCPWSL